MLKLVKSDNGEAPTTRALVTAVFVKLALLVIAAIVVLRVALPYLIDAHSDLALILAFALGIVSVAALIWFVFDLYKTLRRARRRRYG